MTHAAHAVRRRPLLALTLAGALALATFLVWPAARSDAQPPANDTCGAGGAGAQELTLSVPVTGDTSEATNTYTAEPTPTVPGVPASIVPAGGPDVVYRVDLTETVPLAKVTVKAPFQVSVYAFPVVPGLTTAADCGRALYIPALTFANDGGSLPLINFGNELGTQWYIVVDGWTPDDRGSFEIAVSPAVNQFNAIVGLDNTQAIVGSLLRAIDELRPDIQALLPSILGLAPQLTQWDFAEGSTRDGFRMFITLLSDVDQDVVFSYFVDPATLPPGSPNPIVQTVSLVGGQRRTVIANDPATGGAGPEMDFSTRIVGTAPFQAQAILYSNRDVGLGVATDGVQNIAGVSN